MIFQGYFFFLLPGWAGLGPQLKISLRFYGLQKIFFFYIMVTFDQEEKVLYSQNIFLWIFLEKRYLIWRYAELNRLLVGSSLIPFDIDLEQDDRTVCCNHKIVSLEHKQIKQIKMKANRDSSPIKQYNFLRNLLNL